MKPCRLAPNNFPCRHVPSDDSSRPDHGAPTDLDTGEDNGARADRSAIAHNRRLCRVPDIAGLGPAIVCQHDARSEKHAVLEHGAMRDEAAVVEPHTSPDLAHAANPAAGADDRTISDHRSAEDRRELPYGDAVAERHALGDEVGRGGPCRRPSPRFALTKKMW